MKRICTSCHQEKELDKFVKTQIYKGTQYYRYLCKECLNTSLRTGKPNTGRFQKGSIPINKGIPLTEETKKKCSESLKGKTPWNKGKKWLQPTRRKSTRNGHLDTTWKKNVKERDGNKCVECSSTYRLAAHHIKPWKDYPELRFDLNNGKTLCCKCHIKIDGFKKGHSLNKGKKHTEEHKKKNSESHIGRIAWNKGHVKDFPKEKKCDKCLEIKEINKFGFSGKWYRNTCKTCKESNRKPRLLRR